MFFSREEASRLSVVDYRMPLLLKTNFSLKRLKTFYLEIV